MVVIIADPILITSRRAGRLNASDKPLGDQNPQGVVHRLQRDRPNFGPDDLGHAVGRNVGLTRYGPQYSQSLGRDLNAALAKELSWVADHAKRVAQILDRLQIWIDVACQGHGLSCLIEVVSWRLHSSGSSGNANPLQQQRVGIFSTWRSS